MTPSLNDRELPDWLTEFVGNTQWGEAPARCYFWVGVGTIAAALRRRVWFDMGTFKWFPNLYILIVGPPAVINKSSTADLGFEQLLRQVPGIHFLAATLTWQSLYDAYAEVGEEIDLGNNTIITQHALALASSEFGITLDPRNTEMVDQLVHIWDGRRMSKRTRKDGELVIPTPCLNMIACTTPAWISENLPRYLIGGGLTSRLVMVYGDAKERYIAYPKDHMPLDYKERQGRLVRDLERISLLKGEFSLDKAAKDWGTEWYERFLKTDSKKLDPILVGGYIARKQTLVHKVAMCLSASQGDSMIITLTDLQRAEALLTELEAHMPLIYSKIGMTKESNASEQIIAFLERYDGKAPFSLLFRYMHRTIPLVQDIENILRGMIEAGYVNIDRAARTVHLIKK